MQFLEASAKGTVVWDSLDDLEFLEASASLWSLIECGIDCLQEAILTCGLIFSVSVSYMAILETVASTWQGAFLSDIDFLESAAFRWSEPATSIAFSPKNHIHICLVDTKQS